MAVFLGYFLIKTIIESGQLAFIMFFAVYGIDAAITILNRLKKRENIFQPHRSHLYQYLANEMGLSHVLVACIYAVLQLGINILLIYLDASGDLNLIVAIAILLSLVVVYMLLRQLVLRKIVLGNS